MSFAPIPNTRRLLAAMVAATASSVPVAWERFIMAAVDALISSVEKPIMPRDCIPAATWAAVKAVDAPRLFARSPNADSFSA